MATTHPPETNFNTVTSWLPLTTTFPYRSGCSSAIWARGDFIISRADAVVFDPGYGITVDPGMVCMPSQVTLWWETETAPIVNGQTTLYSIGPIVCPESFTTAGTAILNDQSTRIACCPSGYKFRALEAAGVVGECTSPVSKGAVVTYVMENIPGTISAGLTTTSTTMANDYIVLGVPVNGYNFAAPTTSSSPTSSGPSATTSTTSSSTPSPTKTPSVGGGGLSTGAKAGIGVAAAVAGIAFIILAFLLMRYFRKGKAGWAGHNGNEKAPGGPVHELHNRDLPHEIGSSNPRPPELA